MWKAVLWGDFPDPGNQEEKKAKFRNDKRTLLELKRAYSENVVYSIISGSSTYIVVTGNAESGQQLNYWDISETIYSPSFDIETLRKRQISRVNVGRYGAETSFTLMQNLFVESKKGNKVMRFVLFVANDNEPISVIMDKTFELDGDPRQKIGNTEIFFSTVNGVPNVITAISIANYKFNPDFFASFVDSKSRLELIAPVPKFGSALPRHSPNPLEDQHLQWHTVNTSSLAKDLDNTGNIKLVSLSDSSGKTMSYLYNSSPKIMNRVCSHTIPEDEFVDWLQDEKTPDDDLCPECQLIKNVSDLSI